MIFFFFLIQNLLFWIWNVYNWLHYLLVQQSSYCILKTKRVFLANPFQILLVKFFLSYFLFFKCVSPKKISIYVLLKSNYLSHDHDNSNHNKWFFQDYIYVYFRKFKSILKLKCIVFWQWCFYLYFIQWNFFRILRQIL